MGTADGWDKSDALSGSQAALAQEVNDFKKGKGVVTVTAMKARPQPHLARVGLGRSLRQAGRGNGQVLHCLLARRHVASGLHVWRQGLLAASPIGHGQAARRVLGFPPPWTVEKIAGGLKVIDANGQSLAYVYSRETKDAANIAGVLTEDEARRIASNIAKLPALLSRRS